jgi:hypothetical protein
VHRRSQGTACVTSARRLSRADARGGRGIHGAAMTIRTVQDAAPRLRNTIRNRQDAIGPLRTAIQSRQDAVRTLRTAIQSRQDAARTLANRDPEPTGRGPYPCEPRSRADKTRPVAYAPRSTADEIRPRASETPFRLANDAVRSGSIAIHGGRGRARRRSLQREWHRSLPGPPRDAKRGRDFGVERSASG